MPLCIAAIWLMLGMSVTHSPGGRVKIEIIISIGTLTLQKVLRQLTQYVQVLAMEIVSMLQPFIDAFKTKSSFLMHFLGPL